jgi:hypothetical protein
MNKLDERQLWIRGQVYSRSFYLLIALLVINAFVTASGYTWAPPFYADMLIVNVTLMFCVTQLIPEGIYAQTKKQRNMFIFAFGFWFVTGTIQNGADLLHGVPFFSENALSAEGAGLIFALLFLPAIICLVLENKKDKKQNSDE